MTDTASLPMHIRPTGSEIFERARGAVPFDYWAMAGLNLDGYRLGAARYIQTDFPSAAVERYYAEKLHLADVFLKVAMASEVPVTEETVYNDMTPDLRVVNLFNSVGVRNRTLIPLRSNGKTFAGFTISRQTPFSAGEIHFLSLMAGPIHDELTTETTRMLAIQLYDLKVGEIECLEHASRGLTSEKISVASAYTVDTVNSYLKSVVNKMRVANRVEAVAEAIRQKIID
ncbi:MAG: hypothetical protein EON58_14745 [Alphaproteobacteria bacterium]|nr:MAG: hypothetical protein EON58_14745 [Alphaproteobacteria bacterium]